VRVDRFHDIPDVSSGLLNVNDSGVFESGTLDERKEIVVERHQNPVLLDRVREVFPVGVAQSSLVTSRVDGPATTAESVRDRNSDTLVTVQRPHAGGDSADRKSSMLS
jgi:hypothetical protein